MARSEKWTHLNICTSHTKLWCCRANLREDCLHYRRRAEQQHLPSCSWCCTTGNTVCVHGVYEYLSIKKVFDNIRHGRCNFTPQSLFDILTNIYICNNNIFLNEKKITNKFINDMSRCTENIKNYKWLY